MSATRRFSAEFHAPSPIVTVLQTFDIAESTHKGVNWRSKDVTQPQQQTPESPMVTQLFATQVFMHLVFTRMTGESYRLRSLFLCLSDVFRALINTLDC